MILGKKNAKSAHLERAGLKKKKKQGVMLFVLE